MVIVATAAEVGPIAKLFFFVQKIFTICGASCKRNDALRTFHLESIQRAIASGDIQTGSELNQARSLGSISTTRWNCRLSALRAISSMFSSIRDVLEMVASDAADSDKRVDAESTLEKILLFDFIFPLFLMTEVLSVTNILSTALQKQDQDLVNACALISASKQEIQSLRDEGFSRIFQQALTFAKSCEIDIPDMQQKWEPSGRRMRVRPLEYHLSYEEYYKVVVFLPVLDKLQKEMEFRFSDSMTSLMELAACIDPTRCFYRFDIDKILRLADIYPVDIKGTEHLDLEIELRTFKSTVTQHPDFRLGLSSISDLLSRLVLSGLQQNFPLYCRLIRLILTLPVSTATTERSFSALKIVKTRLRTSIGDPWLPDLLILYIEQEMARSVLVSDIIDGFNAMKTRRI